MIERLLSFIFLSLSLVGCGSGLNTKNSAEPTGQVFGQCSEAFMDDLNQILISKARSEKTQDDRSLQKACARFKKLHRDENCQMNDNGQNRTLGSADVHKICQQPVASHPPQPSQNAPLVREIKELRLKVKDKTLASKMLFQKTNKVNAAMVRGNLTRAQDLARHLKEGRTVCVLLSLNPLIPEADETLRSSKIIEKPTPGRGFSTLIHLQVLTTWKDQFFSLHCEKTGYMSTADIQSSVGAAFTVSPL